MYVSVSPSSRQLQPPDVLSDGVLTPGTCCVRQAQQMPPAALVRGLKHGTGTRGIAAEHRQLLGAVNGLVCDDVGKSACDGGGWVHGAWRCTLN